MRKSIRLRSGAESGQALVLVLLSLAVVLTLVLFILSRSVTDILVSSKNAEAARAFSAAEAGIEQALVIGTGSGGQDITVGNAKYSSSVTGFAENKEDFNYPIPMNSGDSMTAWFVSHDSDGNLVCDATHPCFTGSQMYVCWGDPSKVSNPDTVPAIEVSIFYETVPMDPATVQIKRITADSNDTRRVQNNFETGVGVGCPNGQSYAFSKLISFVNRSIPYSDAGNLQFARVKMFYNSDSTQPVSVTVMGSGGTLPSQGQDVVSTGVAGQANRRVEVFQAWPEPPEVFFNSIYSGVGLTK